MARAKPGYLQNFLTPAELFYEVTRSRPYKLPAEAQVRAELTPETWKLQIVPDRPPWQPTLRKTFRKRDNTALTMKDLEELFRARPIRCFKVMECLLNPPPNGYISNGLWEGVALRDVLARLGPLKDVRRLYYSGYHETPEELFTSSLSLSEAMEAPPGQIPVFLALRLNGRPLPVERGGPVRLLVPNGYGFKSIKWLNRIVLTNDYRANDDYATEDARNPNDPHSPLKSTARIDIYASQKHERGQPILLRGVAAVGASGLKRVEYWLRPDQGTHGKLDPDDPAWAKAEWKAADLPDRPPDNWTEGLPGGKLPERVYFLDEAGKPKLWPLPFTWAPWTVRLENLSAGAYEFRVRAVDLNDFAQPEPNPNRQSGDADVPCLTLVVT